MSEPEGPKRCEVCGQVVPTRRYQDDSARACRPQCARALAYREHPDLGTTRGRLEEPA